MNRFSQHADKQFIVLNPVFDFHICSHSGDWHGRQPTLPFSGSWKPRPAFPHRPSPSAPATGLRVRAAGLWRVFTGGVKAVQKGRCLLLIQQALIEGLLCAKQPPLGSRGEVCLGTYDNTGDRGRAWLKRATFPDDRLPSETHAGVFSFFFSYL